MNIFSFKRSVLSLALASAFLSLHPVFAADYTGSELYVHDKDVTYEYDNVTLTSDLSSSWYSAYLTGGLKVNDSLNIELTGNELSSHGLLRAIVGNGGNLSVASGGNISITYNKNKSQSFEDPHIVGIYNTISEQINLGEEFSIGITNFNSNISLYGIQNRASANTISGGSLTLNLTNHATTPDTNTIGIYNLGQIDFDSLNLDITSNTTSYGLWGVHSGDINIGDLQIDIDTVTLGQKTDTSDDVGIYLSGEQNESLSLTSDSITINLNSASGALGLWVDVDQAEIKTGSLTVTGEAQGRIYGVLLEDNTTENEKRFTVDTVLINLTGHNGYAAGLLLNGANYKNTIGSADIQVQSDGENGNAEAMQIRGRQDAHNTVTVTGDLTLNADSGNSSALGAFLQYADLTVDGALSVNAHSGYAAAFDEDTLMVSGLVARDDSQVNVNGVATVNVSNNNAHMVSILSRDNSTITFNNALNASMSGKTDVQDSTVLSAIGGTISATHGGVINANGGFAARVAGTDLSGEVRQGHIILASDENNTLQILGDLYAKNESIIDATLGEGSQFIGRSETNGQGQVNLTLNGGQWKPTSTSSISSLGGKDGLVDLSGLTADDEIAIDRYSGDHHFYTEEPSVASVNVTQKDTGSQVTVITDAQTNDNYNHTEDLVEALSTVVTDANGGNGS